MPLWEHELRNAYVGEYFKAYYPFESDYKDALWRSPDATPNSTVIWLYGWVNCLNFNNSYAYIDWIYNLNRAEEYTLCAWVYVNSHVWINYYGNANWAGSWFEVYSSSTGWVRWWNPTNTQTSLSWVGSWWHLLAQVWVVGWAGNWVVDWVWTTKVASWLVATWNTTNQLNIWALCATWPVLANNGYISKLIIENRAWTQQEMTDYYNQTKWDYGIS